jgi:hypothetical protein
MGHIRVLASGETLVASGEPRFRTLDDLATALSAAGFVIKRRYGDWNRGPFHMYSSVAILAPRGDRSRKVARQKGAAVRILHKGAGTSRRACIAAHRR